MWKLKLQFYPKIEEIGPEQVVDFYLQRMSIFPFLQYGKRAKFRFSVHSPWSRWAEEKNQSLCPHSLPPTDHEIIRKGDCGKCSLASTLLEHFTLIAKREHLKQREKKVRKCVFGPPTSC